MKKFDLGRAGVAAAGLIGFLCAGLLLVPTAFATEGSIVISQGKELDSALRDDLSRLAAASSDPLTPAQLGDFKRILETKGWPTYKTTGRSGIDAAGKLLLQASSDFDFQQEMLRVLDEQVGVDIDPLGYARLSDRIQIRQDQTQRYGTLLGLVGGQVAIDPVLDGIGGARFFRDFYGLPSVDEQIAAAKNEYAGGKSLSELNREPLLSANFKPYTQPAIRQQLGEMIAGDQATRAKASEVSGAELDKLLAEMREIDQQNIGKIEAIFDHVGFPDVQMVGRDGVSTAFLLVQHATDDPAFQRRALDLAKPLVESRQMSKQQYAALTDRVLLAEGKQQLYGTQTEVVKDKVILRPLTDPDNVDARRAAMAMGPLADYIELLQKRYGKK